MQQRRKCVICNLRPVLNGGAYCQNCNAAIAAEYERRKPRVAFVFHTYKGIVVGYFRNSRGTLTPELLNRNPSSLPKFKTLDLDRWCNGWSKDQIKGFKAVCMKLGMPRMPKLVKVRKNS